LAGSWPPEAWKALLDAEGKGNVTLLSLAKDEEHNQAVVLKEFLEGKMWQALDT